MHRNYIDTIVETGTGNALSTWIGRFYTLTVTDASSCSSTTSTPAVGTGTQHAIPKVKATGATLDAGANFFSYQWYLNGVLLPGATGRTNVVSAGSGFYTVGVSDTSALHCSGRSAPFNYTAVGVAGTGFLANAIKLYPNLSDNIVHIDSPVPVSISVFGMDGRHVLYDAHPTEFSIGTFADGIYRVIIRNNNGEFLTAEKIIKITR